MSRRASRLGPAWGSTKPRNSFDDSRPDRMPPSAPELDRWAGTSTSSAGKASKRANDFSRVTPASALMHPASTRMGTDSRTMRRKPSVDDSHPTASRSSDTATRTAPTVGVTTGIPSNSVPRNSAGSVRTSPRVETRGAATLSRSQPLRTAPPVRASAAPSTTSDPSTPPTMDTVDIDNRSIESAIPNPTAIAFATTASASEIAMVSSIDATTF